MYKRHMYVTHTHTLSLPFSVCVYVASAFSDIYVQRGILFAAQCTAKIAYEVRHELHLLLLVLIAAMHCKKVGSMK